MRSRAATPQQGFTLIELSIVLVIIGLIVGGVLVGQDLIRSAEIRATVSQIEKYNTAVNTFRGKYAALPGDLNAFAATQFGFAARGANAGQGDGNAVIECWDGTDGAGSAPAGVCQGGGETALFWQDLSTANGLNLNLVDGSFATAGLIPVAVTTANTPLFMPAAKLGRGNFVYVLSGGIGGGNGVNYFGIGVPSAITVTTGVWSTGASMSPQQAYNIDKKMDDGLPGSGTVTAVDISSGTNLAAWVGATINTNGTITAATSQSATTCYDNGGTLGAAAAYSLANGGVGSTCALSFRFQ